MINNDDNFLTIKNNQFVLSYELLYLLRWIADHDTQALKAIVTKALNSGLKKELQKLDMVTTSHGIDVETEDIQETLTEFFNILETHLAEGINEETIKKARENKLMSTIEKIDTSVCNDEIVRFSIENVTKNMDDSSTHNPKEQFFKELLKQWKPHNKNTYN